MPVINFDVERLDLGFAGIEVLHQAVVDIVAPRYCAVAVSRCRIAENGRQCAEVAGRRKHCDYMRVFQIDVVELKATRVCEGGRWRQNIVFSHASGDIAAWIGSIHESKPRVVVIIWAIEHRHVVGANDAHRDDL